MQIKAFSEKYNISMDTARFYEAEGLLHPIRKNNGYRFYDENCEKTIKFIQVLKHTGFSLQEIKLLLELEQRPISEECNLTSTLAFSAKIIEIQQKISFYQDALHVLQTAKQLMENGLYAQHQNKLEALIEELYQKIADTFNHHTEPEQNHTIEKVERR